MWTALLTGEPQRQAMAASREIGEALARPSGRVAFLQGDASDGDASLGTGTAGLALTLGLLTESRVLAGAEERAQELLRDSTDAMATDDMDASLFGGHSGIAWVYSRLSGLPGSRSDDDELSEIDDGLEALLGESPWTQDYDLVSGLVGIGVYALERLPRQRARRCLERIVDRLEEMSEPRDGGLTWHTAPRLLTEYQLRTTPHGYYNLGLAHGVPGIVALLGQIFATDIAAEKARHLLDGAVTWLLGQRFTEDASYTYWISRGLRQGRARLAWCYGDPGVAAALLLAARCVGEAAWESHAVDIALHSARRPEAESGVVDASVCHGSAGLGHILNRIYQRTKNEQIRAAALSWFDRTLRMRHPGVGIGGFTTALKNLDGTVSPKPDPSFLSGAAGVALALAAAATPVEPDWDRALLLSSRFER